jgi:hypothetical protein
MTCSAGAMLDSRPAGADGCPSLTSQAVRNGGPQLYRALAHLDAVYGGRAFETTQAREQDRAEVLAATGSRVAGAYNEICPSAFAELVVGHAAGVEGQVLFDLGSGSGKTVILAWLLGLEAVGIELAQNRWRESCDAVDTLRRLHGGSAKHSDRGVRMYHGSFLGVRFAAADILFLNAMQFDDEMVRAISCAAREMRPGAYVISSSADGGGLTVRERFRLMPLQKCPFAAELQWQSRANDESYTGNAWARTGVAGWRQWGSGRWLFRGRRSHSGRYSASQTRRVISTAMVSERSPVDSPSPPAVYP